MAPDPLVSCIMPTRDRRAFVPLAIECFLRQDYAERELIVVDDGADAVGDLIPRDSRIRYERLEEETVLGQKRNLACRLAAGELIAHWDDDDWSAPCRLSREIAALRGRRADVVGLNEVLFLDPVTERAWRYSYPQRASRPWVAGGTLCYRRRFWQAHPFPAVAVGEDSRFVWAPDARVVPLEDTSLYVATVHAGNTSVKSPRSPRWRGTAHADVKALLGGEAHAYRRAASRAGAEPVGDADSVPEARGPHVVVTIPYHRCRQHIRQCVESVLGQTHGNLTAVVVNDADPEPPWDLLADLDDARLVRFDLARNRGRYFADEIVLGATESPYILVHDADDWSEPRRVATLLERLRAEHAVGAVSAAYRTGNGTGRPRLVDASRLARPPGPQLVHLANLHGLFRIDALRAVGGFFAGFTIGYDSFLVNALVMTGRIAPVSEPLYHWRVRCNSLTSARETGHGSELRRRTTRELQQMYRVAYRAYSRYLAGELEATALATAIRQLGESRVTPRLRRELDAESRRLAGPLALAREAPAPPALAAARVARTGGRAPRRAKRTSAPAPARAKAQRRPAPHPIVDDVYALLGEPGLRWGGWAISKALAVELAERLEQLRPKRILEIGSGTSTAVLAQHAARRGASMVTLEHDGAHAARTRRLLAQVGLGQAFDLRVARLHPLACPDGRSRPWYQGDFGAGFDFVLMDGPPLSEGRAGVLFALQGRLAEDWELWLDDARRQHERECLQLWERHLPFAVSLHDLDEKGLAVLTPADSRTPAPPARPRGLGLGVLTGGRPDLLRRTLESVAAQLSGVLRHVHVLVHVNGRDRDSEGYASGLSFVDHVVVRPERLSVGEATSDLLTALACTRGVEIVLHLEDDWAACTLGDGWLEAGMAILRSEPDIGQVRLRHRSEQVLGKHMITGEAIEWVAAADALRSRSAHFTFNPSLIRAGDVPRLFPSTDERTAQQRFLAAGLGTAQLSPGVFRHIGTRRSLRSIRPVRVRASRRRVSGGRAA